MGNLDFNAEEVEPQGSFEPLPAGVYDAKIRHTEKKATKKAGGELLQLELEVLGPSHKGRVIFDRLNLWNANQTAVEIAQKTLSAICHAVNILKIKNHEELRGKKVAIKVSVRSDEKYGDSNEVKGYAAIDGTSNLPDESAVSVETPTVSKATPPWAKKA